MFFPFALSYILLLIYREKNKKYLLLNTCYMLLLGLGLSTIFWLPAIYETRYVIGLEIFDISKHFPDLYQLLVPSWGSGFSGMGLENAPSFQIGIANLSAILLSILVLILMIKKKNNNLLIVPFFIFWFTLIFFLMLSASVFV